MQAATGKNAQYVYDAVSENGSTVLLARVLSKVSPTGKGKVTFVMFLSDDEKKQIPEGIEVERTSAGTAHGEDEECEAFSCRPNKWH